MAKKLRHKPFVGELVPGVILPVLRERQAQRSISPESKGG